MALVVLGGLVVLVMLVVLVTLAKSQQKLLSYDPERLGDELVADAVVYGYH